MSSSGRPAPPTSRSPTLGGATGLGRGEEEEVRRAAELDGAGEPEEPAGGRSNTEIAAELSISLATVESHVQDILAELDHRDRPQAIVLAHECGLVPDPAPGRARPARLSP